LSEHKQSYTRRGKSQREKMKVIHDTKNGSWHGISKAARSLNVTPQHLGRVLRGERKSARLSKKVKIVEVK
jgi:hypothetical protein